MTAGDKSDEAHGVAMIPAEKLERIREYALHLDWNVAFGGRSKGNRHLERTVKIAFALSKRKDVREDIVVAGAWLHDVGLHLGNEGHCFSGARFIQPFLDELGLSQDDNERVTHCIEAHDGEVPAKTLEAKVVHDADTLDKMGPLGFVRHVWKIANITDHDPSNLADEVEKHLPTRLEKIYIPEAKERAVALERELQNLLKNRKLLVRLTSLVAEGSRTGVPTEEIVAELIRSDFLPESTLDVLREQLDPQ
ncbi:MAG: HD domain-containing protein [Thermoplasmata archaeon]|nr:HD domain-containing protein [Thermoplasmata archaeon]